MVILHFITNTFPPTEGGLEKRLQRVTGELGLNGFKVLVYLVNSDEDSSKYEKHVADKVGLRLIGKQKNLLEAPLRNSIIPDHILNAEKFRIDSLVLKNLITEEIRKSPQGTHVLISNFITTCGFIASSIASDLQLKHIACIVGTDFSKGYYNPFEKFIVEDVLKTCDSVLTLNRSVARAIEQNYREKKIFTIHTSVKESVKKHLWKKKEVGKQITFFSDCGYCHKKSTQILLWAFEQLSNENYDVKLVLCGKTNKRELDYWKSIRQKYASLLPGKIVFFDYLNESEVSQRIVSSDIYCYPTLSEGCSNSRIAALCIGIPMITTMCGEIIDLCENVSHVYTCLPGDPAGFYNTMKIACEHYWSNKLSIDSAKVYEWRDYLTSTNELNKWIQAINLTLNNHGT